MNHKGLTKKETSKILLSWLKIQGQYEQLAAEIRRLMEKDPSFPLESTHLIFQRVKREERLIEKIATANREKKKSAKVIGPENYQSRVEDLLGIKIICLRPTDVEKVDRAIRDLAGEKRLVFARKPVVRKPLIFPVRSKVRSSKTDEVDLHYEGYASVHYIVRLGRNSDALPQLRKLKAEIQLRTILEEAWGEIDHKYKYELIRSGKVMPDHLRRTFRVVGWYLQVAGQQLEYGCEEVDRLRELKHSAPRQISEKKTAKAASGPKVLPGPTQSKPAHGAALTSDDVLHMKLSERTLTYIKKRVSEHEYITGKGFPLNEAFTPQILDRFGEIYREELAHEPFSHQVDREADVVFLLNFAIFSQVQPREVADQGLRTRLQGRRREIIRW